MSRILMTIAVLTFCAAFAFAQNGAASPSDAPPKQTQPSGAAPVRVPTGIMLGRVEHKTMPVYPPEAMKNGIQGDVTFKIEVDETGKITASEPIGGDPLLVDASKEALRTFRFHPYVVNGTPTKVQSQLGYHFTVEKAGDGVSGHVECMSSIPNRP